MILKKPRVDSDLAAHFDFIAQDKLEPAERFLEVAAAAFERLARMPGIGARWESADSRLAGIRMYPLPGPYRSYLVFYRPISNGIDVLCILHGARDLGRALYEALG